MSKHIFEHRLEFCSQALADSRTDTQTDLHTDTHRQTGKNITLPRFYGGVTNDVQMNPFDMITFKYRLHDLRIIIVPKHLK